MSPKTRAKAKSKAFNPYRAGSAYHRIYGVLWRYRKAGISRDKILDILKREMPDKKATLGFSLAVVSSPSEDGAAHRSARSASLKADYWVQKRDNAAWLRLRFFHGRKPATRTE
jgi:hypothetical protein